MSQHYGETHMGLHIGNINRGGTFDCMKERARKQERERDAVRGARVRTFRLAMELTQTELAEKLGVDQSTVSDIENGAGFSADILMTMSDVFKLSPAIIMRGSDETSWPFAHIGIEEFLAVKPEDRPFVEGRLAEFIGQVMPPKPLNAKALTPVRRRSVTAAQKK